MGTVVQFKRGTAEAGRLGNAAGIDAIQSWLAITIQAVEANATSIVKNITTIETILVSTDDHELRAPVAAIGINPPPTGSRRRCRQAIGAAGRRLAKYVKPHLRLERWDQKSRNLRHAPSSVLTSPSQRDRRPNGPAG